MSDQSHLRAEDIQILREEDAVKLPDKRVLREKADQLWSYAVQERWGWRCAVCGRTDGKLDAHHLVPRGHYATRYLLCNGICLCFQCHTADKDYSPHENAAGWTGWLEENHPEIAAWYHENRHPPAISGATTKGYFIEVIQGLRLLVPDEEFRRITGVRLTAWLDEQVNRT